MFSDIVVSMAFLFIIVFTFDASFNIRRLIKSLDRIWRKLAEINDGLQKK